MQDFNQLFVAVPENMGADFSFVYSGNKLYSFGGIAPGDIVCVRFTKSLLEDGLVVVMLNGKNILCMRVNTARGEMYYPADPRAADLPSPEKIELVGKVVGLMRYFPSRTEAQNDVD